MMRARSLIAAAGLVAAAAPTVASADHPFILPSNTSYSGPGNTVTLDAAGSDHVFFFDHRPLAPDTISVLRPDATMVPVTPVRTRFRTILDLPLDRSGTWKIASTQTNIGGTLKLDGVERRVGGRGGPPAGGERLRGDGAPGGDRLRGDATSTSTGTVTGGERRLPPIAVADIPASATDVHLVEQVSTTETFVTVDAPSETVLKPTGRALEFAPVTHPNMLVANEPARFRFLLDGQPAAGLAVTVIPGGDRYRADDRAMTLTTDRDGAVSVRWPMAGMYWLGVEAEDRHPTDTRAERRRMSYSATLEVAAP